MKRFFAGIPKVLFAILCYLSAVILAILSGYFTIIFYSQSQTGWNMWAMGGLAGMLEFIKFMLATSYPFMQYRDDKREKKVLFYLKICLILSIMASLNFFLTGGEIERSPASNITILLYDYIPVFNIIPLKFSQFITTMSLSILIEVFIIFLPILAPIMFLEKDYSRKKKYNANTNFEKIKEIVTVIPERLIDKLHKKVITNNLKIEGPEEDIKVKEMKPKLKILKLPANFVQDKDKNKESKNNNDLAELKNNKSISTFVQDKDENKELKNKQNLTINDSSKFAQDKQEEIKKSTIELVREAIELHRDVDKAPSISQIMEITGLPQGKVNKAKKTLSEEGYIVTIGRNTYIPKYSKKEREKC